MLKKAYAIFVGRVLSIFLLVMLSQSAFCIRFLDFSEYDFGTGKKGLRLVDFNVDAQKFENIYYYKYPASARTVDYEGFSIKLKTAAGGGMNKISCTAKEKFNSFSISLLESFESNFHTDIVEEIIIPGHKVFWKKMPDLWIKEGTTIMDTLNEKSKQARAGDDFEVVHLSHAVPDWTKSLKRFSQIVEGPRSRVINNEERRLLGELTTTLTMARFGYKQRPSKHGRDHGFDGVFLDLSDSPDLFITEAKNRAESFSVGRYMDDCLAEICIAKVLPKLTHPDLETTKNKIEEFIRDSPEKIFKLVQRVRKDGTIQCLVRNFDKTQYDVADGEGFYIKRSDEMATVIESFSKGVPLGDVLRAFVTAMKTEYTGEDVTDDALRAAFEAAL